MAFKDQPSYIIQMRAKPGQGDRLFQLATEGMHKSGASDRFIMMREDADPDVLWNIEVFRSEAAKSGYETSLLADELRDEILALLDGPVMRVEVHPYAAIPTLPGDSD
jgi:quinol monooxygenase YgiN